MTNRAIVPAIPTAMRTRKCANVLLTLVIGAVTIGLGWAVLQTVPAPVQPLSKSIPSGAVLYLQARDFSSLLADWNKSPEKQRWLGSSNYQVFSRSRLFLRLRDAGSQFATAAGLPPDAKFLGQIAGSESALALYDIGKIQFLYITRLPSTNSLQSQLWQTRSKFESRSAGGTTFYIRRAPDSEREVAFAISGDYLLLSTREDLMAGALQLLTGGSRHDAVARSIESDPWWSQSVAAAGAAGDLRMVLNLEKIVPSPYFRSYWIQQNVSDMKQYTAAISDLFRSNQEYREERVLLKRAADAVSSVDESGAVADLVRLVPDNTGVYEARDCPSIESCFDPLQTKLLAPHLGTTPAAPLAPQPQLTSGETGSSLDLETRIDQPPRQNASDSRSSGLKQMLRENSVQAVLQVQSTERAADGVFVKVLSAVALAGGSAWSEAAARSALANFVRPNLTTAELGVGWRPRNGYYELDGLETLVVAVRGRYLIVSDDSSLISAMLANMNRRVEARPARFVAGFEHRRERQRFLRFTSAVDRPDTSQQDNPGNARTPQFFSENIASLSSTLSGFSSEKIVVRSAGDKELQTVTYKCSQ